MPRCPSSKSMIPVAKHGNGDFSTYIWDYMMDFHRFPYRWCDFHIYIYTWCSHLDLDLQGTSQLATTTKGAQVAPLPLWFDASRMTSSQRNQMHQPSRTASRGNQRRWIWKTREKPWFPGQNHLEMWFKFSLFTICYIIHFLVGGFIFLCSMIYGIILPID